MNQNKINQKFDSNMDDAYYERLADESNEGNNQHNSKGSSRYKYIRKDTVTGTEEDYSDKLALKKQRKSTHSYFSIHFKNLAIRKKALGPNEMMIVGAMNTDNEVIISAKLKKDLNKEYEVTEDAINSQIRRMIKFDFLIRLANTHYMVNPYLFSKGAHQQLENKRAKYDELKKERMEIENVKAETKSQMDEILALCDEVLPTPKTR